MDAAPDRLVDQRVLPNGVRALLDDEERVLYWAQPIRLSLGLGVWMIFALGPIFATAGAMAFEEFVGRGLFEASGVVTVASLAAAALASFLVACGVFFLCFPFFAFSTMRRTHALVTDRRVLRVRLPTRRGIRQGKAPKVEQWSPTRCDSNTVVRRRRQSATLVLSEHTEERRSDGRMVYKWEAIHGLPRAKEAQRAVDWMRQNAFRALHSNV